MLRSAEIHKSRRVCAKQATEGFQAGDDYIVSTGIRGWGEREGRPWFLSTLLFFKHKERAASRISEGRQAD